MLASIVSLFALFAILAASYGVGRPLARALRLDDDDPLAVSVWSIALGLVVAGTAWLLLGLCGCLQRELICVLTVVAACWGLGELLQVSIRARAYLPRASEPKTDCSPDEPQLVAPSRWLIAAVGGAAMFALLASLVSALAPPTAGDALCYHLELPKRFLVEQRLAYLPDHENSTFPLLVEMWYLWALALDGGVAAQLVHWALGVGLALAAVLLARGVVGRTWSWLAGAIVLLTPGISNQMTAPLNDVGLAVLTTLAVVAWWRAAIDDEGSQWYLAAGLMLGGAFGTKYLALLFAAAWFGVWAILALRARKPLEHWWRGAATMLILATALAGPWYARAAWHRGNPVYPFFHTALDSTARETIRESKLAQGRTPWGIAAAPWAVTMHPERFGGRGHQLGCLFLAVLPALCCVRRLRGVRLLLSISGVYFVGCFLLRQNVRFLFPLVPLLAIPCVWAWLETRRWPRPCRALVALSLGGMLLLGALWPAYRARQHWPVALGGETRAAYLERAEPSYAASLLANVVVRQGARILSQDNHAFYFAPAMTQELLYRRRTQYNQRNHDLATTLRGDGFEYLLLASSTGDVGIEYDPTLSQLVDNALANGNHHDFDELVAYDIEDSDGATRHYRLVRINPASTAQSERVLK